MMAAGLAAAAAAAWGGADYCGGRAARHATAPAVTVVAFLLGHPVLLLYAVLLAGRPRVVDLAWGAAAGAAELGGLVLLYRALADGQMAQVAPVSALTTSLVPMAVGVAIGPTPTAVALSGAACAAVAVPLVSAGSGGAEGPRRARLRPFASGMAAGVLFGAFFILLARTGTGSGLWPVVAARSMAIALGLLATGGLHRHLQLPPVARPWVAAAAAGEVAASVLYLLAVRGGLLSVVAPIVALAPAITVLLAVAIDRERLRPVHCAGLALAAAAIVLTGI